MRRKCCVKGCDGNYNKENKITVYRLPNGIKEKGRKGTLDQMHPEILHPDTSLPFVPDIGLLNLKQ